MNTVPWALVADGISLSIRLTPKGGRDRLDGIAVLSDGRPVLKARVSAAPEDGAANAALIALVAETLGIPRSSASLAAGHKARLKTVHVTGDGAALSGRLASLFAAQESQ